jgi:hypothetical protein
LLSNQISSSSPPLKLFTYFGFIKPLSISKNEMNVGSIGVASIRNCYDNCYSRGRITYARPSQKLFLNLNEGDKLESPKISIKTESPNVRILLFHNFNSKQKIILRSKARIWKHGFVTITVFLKKNKLFNNNRKLGQF